MNSVWMDLRYAVRMMRRSPGFAAVVVLTLALGIGANTAIFSLIDAVLLRALPVENPAQLMLLKWHARNMPDIHGYMTSGDCPTSMSLPHADDRFGCSFSEPMFHELEKTSTFSGLAAFSGFNQLDLSGNGAPSVINGQVVSGNFFRTMGVKAALGRMIDAADDRASAPAVAVLNYGYWQSAFGGSPSVIGRTIQLNSVPFTIVGVAEQRFTGITPGSDYDVWLPLSVAKRITDPMRWRDREGDVGFWWLTLVARLKSDEKPTQAQAVVSSLFRNEMLHGPVPLFHAGARGLPGSGGPAAGGGVVRREMFYGGGAPPPHAGPAPVTAPPPHVGPITEQPRQAAQALRRSIRQAPGGATPQSGGNQPLLAQGQPRPAGPVGNRRAIVLSPPGGPKAAAPGGLRESNAPRTLSAPADNPEIQLVPAQTGLVGARGTYEDPLYALMLAVGIILVIACANVASLMLARAASRQKEMALRLALGAGRKRIVRQLLTESVLLSVVGGALGVLFAFWGAAAIVSFVSSNQPRSLGFAAGVDLRVLAFAAGISVLTGIFFGIAPAFRSTRVDLTPALKEGEGGSSGAAHAAGKWLGLGNALVVAQVALAVVVLVGAGLLVRTLENLRNVDIGFDSRNLVNFSINPTLIGYSPAQVDSLYRDLQGRFAATPGVMSASYSMVPLLSNRLGIMGFHWPGTPQDQESEADLLAVGPDFFRTMSIPLLAGRDFTASDFALSAANGGEQPASAPTPVVVNQAFVNKYVGRENPLGELFGTDVPPGYEIVGVVRDTKYNNLREDIKATVYMPQRQMGATFELRTAADPQAILPAIRKALAEVNPDLPLFDVSTESQQIDRLLFRERLVARLAGFFALLALVLACIGLYGLLSYEVSRRTREIGIRMALGAQSKGVLKLVMRRGIGLALVGVAVGVGVALGVTRFLGSMLYDVKADDPLTLIAVAAVLAVVALIACYMPARRATQVDPLVALRHE
jgi:predicted permease